MRSRLEIWLVIGALACGASACARTFAGTETSVPIAPALARDQGPVGSADPAPAGSDSRGVADHADEDHQIAMLRSARASFAEFIARAGDDPAYHEAVARSRERIEDIDATIDFLAESKRARLAGGG